MPLSKKRNRVRMSLLRATQLQPIKGLVENGSITFGVQPKTTKLRSFSKAQQLK